MSQLTLDIEFPEQNNQKNSENTHIAGRKSLRAPNRHQVEFQVNSIDDLLPSEHRARDVWEYVCSLDLSPFLKEIKISEGCGGPRTADPRVLLALWLYGTLEGFISARHIAKLTTMHYAYIWICGGVSVNYHTLSDFRTHKTDKFRALLQESIALMWKTGVFSPEKVAQDGTRVKAHAGSKSFRREGKLSHYLKEAVLYLEQLEKEQVENPAASSLREKAARQRFAKERKERLEKAQAEMLKYKEERIKSCKKNGHKLTEDDLKEIRVSTTEPECRKMKMNNGGYSPAYNIQFATSVHKKVILAADVVNTQDPGTLVPMMRQVEEVLQKINCPMPSKWLADSAYANKSDVTEAKETFPETTLYSPPVGNQKVDSKSPRKTDNLAMAELRERMASDESADIYKDRSSTAEFANAACKNKGMREFLVNGLNKVTNMVLIYALVHNMEAYMRAL